MKTSLLAGVAAAALILAAPQASAAGYKPYVSVFGGGAWLTQNPNIYSSDLPYWYNTELKINNPGYIIGGAVGVDWGNQLRTEIELSHAAWSSDKSVISGEGFDPYTTTDGSSVNATYLLGNVWYDLAQGSKVAPYVGGGLGIGWAHINSSDIDSQFSASGLAFQVGAGVRFHLSDRALIDVGYRFKDIVGLNYTDSDGGTEKSMGNGETIVEKSLAAHTFQIGLTYEF